MVCLYYFLQCGQKILFGIWYLVIAEMGNVEFVVPCIIFPMTWDLDESVIYSDKLYILQVLY